MIDLSNRTKKELLKLIDNIKVSDLTVKEKDRLIKECEYRLGNVVREDILKDITESQPDYDDIGE